jgi:hypothetical protein
MGGYYAATLGGAGKSGGSSNLNTDSSLNTGSNFASDPNNSSWSKATMNRLTSNRNYKFRD